MIKYYIRRHRWNPFRKSGIGINITPSFYCNYNCSYCAVDFNGCKPINGRSKTAAQWLEYLNTFPEKIADVAICGGEPTCYYDFIPLAKGLLKAGYFVLIYSNLSKPEILEQLPVSNKLIIVATFHPAQVNSLKFDFAYRWISKLHKIYVDEIQTEHLPYSRVKPLVTDLDLTNKKRLRVSPDFTLYINDTDLIWGEGNK
jgi:organic radical activating enzyme